MDWIDIGLHAGIAIVSAALLYIWAGGFTVWFNTIFWPARELYQHWDSPFDLLFRPQSLLEWVVPVALAWFTLSVMQKVYKHPKYDGGTF